LAEGYIVYGLSRSNDWEQENYRFVPIDLSNLEAVSRFRFNQLGKELTVLVNNAGMIGDISPVGLQDAESIQKTHFVNTIAPQILMNTFVRDTQDQKGKKHILNISSGAGKYPIDAWSVYCSSKAALDLFAETLKEELQSRGEDSYTVHSVSPGVVDTQMQTEIREADPELFLLSDKFRKLKTNQELSSPILAADKLFQIIENPSQFPENLVSLRDF
jgi:benzil reductase ((S)-benzoin forming)